MSAAAAIGFLLFLFVAATVGAFGWAFRTKAATGAALARLERRLPAFRAGFLPLLLGAAVSSEAQAIRWRTGVDITHGAFVVVHLAGLTLTLAGLLMLTVVLWWPE